MNKATYKNSRRSIYHTAQCAHCILEVALKYYQLARSFSPKTERSDFKLGTNQNDSRQSNEAELIASQKLISFIAGAFMPDRTPNEIATDAFHAAINLGLNNQTPLSSSQANDISLDVWREIRMQADDAALKLIPIVRSELEAIENPKDRLKMAIQWSLVGNNLDLGTSGHTFDLGKEALRREFKNIEKTGYAINDFDALWKDLHEYKRVLYLLDNSGEIAFDRLVIELLRNEGIEVKAVVKGGPISNDATMDDAERVGLTEVCEVITTGSADLGFDPLKNSDEFKEILQNTPVVIAKGQANWEATYAYQDMLDPCPIFYNILKIKCDVHAALFNLPKGAYILQKTLKDMIIAR